MKLWMSENLSFTLKVFLQIRETKEPLLWKNLEIRFDNLQIFFFFLNPRSMNARVFITGITPKTVMKKLKLTLKSMWNKYSARHIKDIENGLCSDAA